MVVHLHHEKNQWWIHLRARIRASHARHRGSNPLSTTRNIGVQIALLYFYITSHPKQN